MRPLIPLVPLALATVLVLGGTGCAERSPGALAELLEVMPAAAAERGLFYSHLETDEGFGSALPLRQVGDLLGVDHGGLTDVLETGGAPLTVVAGAIRPDVVAEAVAAHGYDVGAGGSWVTFTREGASASGLALAAAAPAGAARDGVFVLGSAEDIRAVVDGARTAMEAPGIAVLARSVAEAHAVAFVTDPGPIVDAAHERGGVDEALRRGDASGELPPWAAAALVWRAPDDDGFDGAVLVAYDTAVDGQATARALVLRAATTPLLGEGRRTTSDLFERGAPRWDPDRRLARLPVRWRIAAPAGLRSDVEGGALLFLAPAR